MADPLRFAVLGVDHPHAITLTTDLREAGAECIGWAITDDDPGGLFAAVFPDLDRHQSDALLAAAPDLLVLAAVPGDRAELAAAAMRAGADVLVDKPGAIDAAGLDAVAAAHRETGRRWWVAFTEHFTSRAVIRADQLVTDGRIGTVRHVLGTGPHRRGGERPPWFTEPTRAGSVLTDLASHQIHHATRLLGTDDLRVVAARTTPAADASTPDLVGEVLLEGGTGSAYARVDWLTPDGLDSWGDVRLHITGDGGTIEVRANIDPAGRPGADHLVVVDADGTEHIDCAADELDWATRVVIDVGAGTETLVTTEHCLAVSRLCLEAEALARPR